MNSLFLEKLVKVNSIKGTLLTMKSTHLFTETNYRVLNLLSLQHCLRITQSDIYYARVHFVYPRD